MKVIFIVGPTGAGKSYLAFKWAKSVHGQILNADSVQCFKSLHIGANKPSKQLQAEVPHHLFGIVQEGNNFTAGDFRRSALCKLKELSDQKIPYVFVVGGSGFYLQALLKGMQHFPKSSLEKRSHIIKDMENYGLDFLYKELQDKDPLYAKKVHYRDKYRILRGVEILRMQPQTITQIQQQFQSNVFPYPKALIGLKCDRGELRRSIQIRTCQMLELGFIEEVRELLQRGLRDWPALKSVGYKQVVMFLEGQIKKENLLEEIVQATMRLAKKQMTWFRNKYSIYWIDKKEVNQCHNHLSLKNLKITYR